MFLLFDYKVISTGILPTKSMQDYTSSNSQVLERSKKFLNFCDQLIYFPTKFLFNGSFKSSSQQQIKIWKITNYFDIGLGNYKITNRRWTAIAYLIVLADSDSIKFKKTSRHEAIWVSYLSKEYFWLCWCQFMVRSGLKDSDISITIYMDDLVTFACYVANEELKGTRSWF